MTTGLLQYGIDVVQAGDEASGNFKDACDKANKTTTVAKYFDDDYQLHEGYASKESTDGVGTKVQIYTEAFEAYIQDFDDKILSEDELFKISVDIWERMLHDLIAMNTDDLRNGEMAVSITNIIDINHLKGRRGAVFAKSMAIAMGNIIDQTDIMITAGETAVLDNPKQVGKMLEIHTETSEKIEKCLIMWLGEDHHVISEVKSILDSQQKRIDIVLKEIEFNIGGTAKGITNGKNKLSPLRPGQAIVCLQEISKNGIIGPRSNGITAIRSYMTKLAGSNWENLSFEAFLEMIGDKASSIPEEIRMVCRGKKMWDIATGKSTIFNPFVSRTLLGGVDGEKQVKLSSIIHVTGNPGKKTVEGAPGVDMDLDISEMPVPTIITILQHTLGINGKKAMKGWNMGLPYALICDEDQVDEVIRLAEEDEIIARRIGSTKEESPEGSTIKGVGIDNEEIRLAA